MQKYEHSHTHKHIPNRHAYINIYMLHICIICIYRYIRIHRLIYILHTYIPTYVNILVHRETCIHTHRCSPSYLNLGPNTGYLTEVMAVSFSSSKPTPV